MYVTQTAVASFASTATITLYITAASYTYTNPEAASLATTEIEVATLTSVTGAFIDYSVDDDVDVETDNDGYATIIPLTELGDTKVIQLDSSTFRVAMTIGA